MVNRYDPGCLYAGQDDMVRRDDGTFVTYADYSALEAKYRELAGWALDSPCDRATEELAKEALGK